MSLICQQHAGPLSSAPSLSQNMRATPYVTENFLTSTLACESGLQDTFLQDTSRQALLDHVQKLRKFKTDFSVMESGITERLSSIICEIVNVCRLAVFEPSSTCKHTHVGLLLHTRTHMYGYCYTHTHVGLLLHTHTHTHTHVGLLLHTRTHMYGYCYAHTHTHTHTHTCR